MSSTSPSVGLVLGAGGIAGGAWHAAVLAALQELGWDARTADLMVGTSAGSGMAAALRVGMAPTDMVAGPLGRTMSPDGKAYAKRAGSIVMAARTRRTSPARPASPSLALRALRPGGIPATVAAAGVLPEGTASNDFLADRVRRTHDQDWPDDPTWVCAVRLEDGRRVVFGRDVTDAHLGTAVQASSAIPGYYAPVAHGPHSYVDGAVHSPTNADLVADLAFDIIVVSSPMSATSAAIRRPRWTGARALHAATLRREVRRIRDTGTPVLVLQPGPDIVDLIGMNSMDPAKRDEIIRAAHPSVTAHLRSERVADRLAVLIP